MKEITTSQDLCQAGKDRLLIHAALNCDIPAQNRATWIAGIGGYAIGIACFIFGILYHNEPLLYSGVFIGIFTPCMAMTRSRMLRLYQIIRCLAGELEKIEETMSATNRHECNKEPI